MSDRVDALLSDLLGLARAQKAALEAGDVVEALALMEKRQCVIDQIQGVDDGTVRHRAIQEIQSIDDEICRAVRSGMSGITSRIEEIHHLRESLMMENVPASRKRTRLTA